MATLQRLALRGTPKATKAAARYTPAGGAERCGMCRHYVPSSSCARIEGPVSAAGWCQLYSQQVTWRPRAGQAAGGGIPAGASLDMSFLVPGTLPPLVTFTRASTATYFDATGTMQTAAINTARWDYDPVTHALNGVLVEETRTNLLLNSAALGTQSVTTTAVATTLSFYGTGTVTKSGTATGALVGTGAATRVSQTFTPTAGTLTLTVTGTVQNAQLEAGGFATSYIPTTSAAGVRSGDIMNIPTAGWVNQSTGTFNTEVATADIGPTSAIHEWLAVGTAATDCFRMSHQVASASTLVNVFTANTNRGGPGDPAVHVVNVPFKAAATYDVAAQSVSVSSAGNVPTVATVNFFPTMTVLSIGGAGTVARGGVICGPVRRVRYWPRVLTSAEMQSVTT